MKIIHVEDDYLVAEKIKQEIKKHFPNAQIEIISTESEFRRRLPELVKLRPDLVIMDVMLRWADASPNIPVAPAEVAKDGRFNAGVRCQRLLAEMDSSIPVIFFTVLENGDFQPFRQGAIAAIPYFQKSHDCSAILGKIKEIMQSHDAGRIG